MAPTRADADPSHGLLVQVVEALEAPRRAAGTDGYLVQVVPLQQPRPQV